MAQSAILLVFIFAFLVVGCASSPVQVEDVASATEVKGTPVIQYLKGEMLTPFSRW